MIQLSLSLCQYQCQEQTRLILVMFYILKYSEEPFGTSPAPPMSRPSLRRLILTNGTSLETEMNKISNETRFIANFFWQVNSGHLLPLEKAHL